MAFLCCSSLSCDREGPPRPVNGNGVEHCRIVQVYDGDTIKLDSGETVRLVGIDTPEMHPEPEECATEAFQYTQTMALDRDCYLVYNTSAGDSIDIYGRTLAFVHILPDSLCLNVEIVRAGWSEDWDAFPVRSDYEGMFESAEQEAIAQGRGIWNSILNCE
ncbi:thermonuclease family protein [bacterium]|nr:thermonuclease family protein [bacterium]